MRANRIESRDRWMNSRLLVLTLRRSALMALCFLVFGWKPTIRAAEPTVDDENLLRLYSKYWDAAEDSPAEVAAKEALESALQQAGRDRTFSIIELHSHLVEQRLGADAIREYRQFKAAVLGSEEESNALAAFRQTARKRGVAFADAENLVETLLAAEQVLESLREIRSIEAGANATGATIDEIGGPSVLTVPQVDLRLRASHEGVVAGELWEVIGEVQNRSDQTVWIVDRFSMLSLPPELSGQLAKRGSKIAFFPTVMFRSSDEIVRIEPGQTYSMSWIVDSARTEKQKRTGDLPDDLWGRLVLIKTRIVAAWTEHLFFVPGRYLVTANVHVWPMHPRFDGQRVNNPGDSLTKSASIEVMVEASPWVLIFGAVVGGLFAFALQLMHSMRTGNPVVQVNGSARRRIFALTVGLASAVLLTSIVTILLSRLSSADFLINVEVRDLWGALATGFVIQWWGFRYLAQMLPSPGKIDSAVDSVASPSAVAMQAPEQVGSDVATPAIPSGLA